MVELSWRGDGQVFALDGVAPRIAADVFLAPGTIVLGAVEIGARSSLWLNCAVRADVEAVRIGAGSNIQDGSVIHSDPGYPASIGDEVLIGHAVLLHGATVRDRGFVGMGSTLLNGAVVESDAMLGAGSLLTSGKTVPTGELWAGRPAKFVRPLSAAEIADMRRGVQHYADNAVRYARTLRAIVRP